MGQVSGSHTTPPRLVETPLNLISGITQLNIKPAAQATSDKINDSGVKKAIIQRDETTGKVKFRATASSTFSFINRKVSKAYVFVNGTKGDGVNNKETKKDSLKTRVYQSIKDSSFGKMIKKSVVGDFADRTKNEYEDQKEKLETKYNKSGIGKTVDNFKASSTGKKVGKAVGLVKTGVNILLCKKVSVHLNGDVSLNNGVTEKVTLNIFKQIANGAKELLNKIPKKDEEIDPEYAHEFKEAMGDTLK